MQAITLGLNESEHGKFSDLTSNAKETKNCSRSEVEEATSERIVSPVFLKSYLVRC